MLVKNPPAMRDTWVQSLGWEEPPGEGKRYPLQYSGQENSMDCIVHGVAKSWTGLSDFYFTLTPVRKLSLPATHSLNMHLMFVLDGP